MPLIECCVATFVYRIIAAKQRSVELAQERSSASIHAVSANATDCGGKRVQARRACMIVYYALSVHVGACHDAADDWQILLSLH